MSRELKFRVYSYSTLSFHYFDIYSGHPQGISGIVNDPQQYTGITDEEGVEVYEGDIVKWTEYQGWEDGRTFEGFYEVKWNEESLRFDFYDPYDNSWWDLSDTKFDCVVGNIFQNGELLERYERQND